jgi:hypothetical protein
LRTLDLGFNKLGTEASFAATQALASWVVPCPPITVDTVRRVTSTHPAGLNTAPGDIVRTLTKCPPGDPGFGILRGLSTLYLCGNKVAPEDTASLEATVARANGTVEAAIAAVAAVLVREWDADVTRRREQHAASIVAAKADHEEEVARKRVVRALGRSD